VFEYLEKLEKSDIEVENKKLYWTEYWKFVIILVLLLGIYIVVVFFKNAT
jgi:hypothetical protein